MLQEDSLPNHVDYRKPHVDANLRDLNDFTFFVSTTQELVSLEDISLRPTMSGAGVVLSPADGSNFSVYLQEIIEWIVEFGVSREECAIWVKTPAARSEDTVKSSQIVVTSSRALTALMYLISMVYSTGISAVESAYPSQIQHHCRDFLRFVPRPQFQLRYRPHSGNYFSSLRLIDFVSFVVLPTT
jgi:hypothetical protein